MLKLGASFISGGIASFLFNPFDLVKVRFQSRRPHDPLPYNGRVSTAIATIVKEKGIQGLYSGSSASVARAALLTSAQLGTYDVVKNNMLVQLFAMDKDKKTTHIIASLLTSLFCTTASNPADVLKTRIMNDKAGTLGVRGHTQLILQTEGVQGFMKGWCASYSRIGPHTIITFVLVERIRQLIGLSTY